MHIIDKSSSNMREDSKKMVSAGVKLMIYASAFSVHACGEIKRQLDVIKSLEFISMHRRMLRMMLQTAVTAASDQWHRKWSVKPSADHSLLGHVCRLWRKDHLALAGVINVFSVPGHTPQLKGRWHIE